MRPCLSPSQRARLYASRSTNVKPHTPVYVITIHLFMTHKLIYSPRQRTEKKFHSRSWLTFFIHSVTNANCYFICLHTRLVSHTLTPHEHTPTRWASNNLTAIRIDKNPYLDKYDSTIAAKQTHSAGGMCYCMHRFVRTTAKTICFRSFNIAWQAVWRRFEKTISMHTQSNLYGWWNKSFLFRRDRWIAMFMIALSFPIRRRTTASRNAGKNLFEAAILCALALNAHRAKKNHIQFAHNCNGNVRIVQWNFRSL